MSHADTAGLPSPSPTGSGPTSKVRGLKFLLGEDGRRAGQVPRGVAVQRVIVRVLVVSLLGAGLAVVPPSALPVVSAQPASSYSDEVLADDPLAFWELDESSGTSAADSSGNGNVATYGAAVVLGSGGLIRGENGLPTGSAVTFPGSGSTNRITTPVNGSAAGLVDIPCVGVARRRGWMPCPRSTRRSSSVTWPGSPVGAI